MRMVAPNQPPRHDITGITAGKRATFPAARAAAPVLRAPHGTHGDTIRGSAHSGAGDVATLPSNTGANRLGFSFGNISVFPKQRTPAQPSLTIGPSGDPLEREADLISDRVMRMSERSSLPVRAFAHTPLRRHWEPATPCPVRPNLPRYQAAEWRHPLWYKTP